MAGYRRFILQTGTALHETDASFQCFIAANNDLCAVKKQGTESGSTEVHFLSAASRYQDFLLQTGTALHETDETFDFVLAPNRDLFCIKKSRTGTGSTELHVLSAAGDYQEFVLQTGTGLHETDETFDFVLAPNRDLVAIKKSGTGTGTTEVHILTAASKYQRFIKQTGTGLHETDETWDFLMAPSRNLFCIKKSGTGTGTTEVHVLTAASSYQRFFLQTGTALHETDETFELGLGDWNGDGALDLFVIKKSGTGTYSTEVHVLSGR